MIKVTVGVEARHHGTLTFTQEDRLPAQFGVEQTRERLNALLDEVMQTARQAYGVDALPAAPLLALMHWASGKGEEAGSMREPLLSADDVLAAISAAQKGQL